MSAVPDDPFPNVVKLNAGRANAGKELQRDTRGNPVANLTNCITLLLADPDLRDLFAFNAFTGEQCIRSAPPRPSDNSPWLAGPYPRSVQEADVPLIQAYMQRHYIPKTRRPDVEDAIIAVAAMDSFHPVVDWLGKLEHDGIKRLDSWLDSAFGSPKDTYHSAIGAKLLIAAVRRVRRPGVKFDHMPVLEGAQGIGKSTALRLLFSDPWFSDQVPPRLESKDAAMVVQGIWCLEFAEIEHVVRGEVETIKAFLSRSTDRFRPPWGRRVQTYPRQSVCVGTTNSDEYLRDATGNRRFWPVKCETVKPEWITASREQLWAEAAALEARGETHWLEDGAAVIEARAEQQVRMEVDVWAEPILEAVHYRAWVTIPELLAEPLKIPIERQTKREQMRVSQILRSEGWLRDLAREGGKPARRWLPPPKVVTGGAPMETA